MASGGRPANLKVSTIEGSLYSLMVGCGETLIPAFMLALGFSHVTSGMTSVLPHFAGAFVQLFSGYAVHRLGSRRSFVIGCAVIQALALLAIASLPWIGRFQLGFVYLFASVYWASALAAGPAWNAWMGNEVRADDRIEFFSVRSRFAHLATLVALLGSGVVLQESGRGITMFSALLGAAAAFRFVSALLFAYHSETPVRLARPPAISLAKGVHWVRRTGVFPLLVYLFCVHFSVHVAAPYFSPFLLEVVGLSYMEYMVTLSAALLARVVSYATLSKLARARGAGFLFAFGAVGITPLSFLYTLSTSFPYLAALQVLSGITWASFELGLLLTLLDKHDERDRARILTGVNFLNAVAMLSGSLLGAYFLKSNQEGMTGYQWSFYVSSVGRTLPLLLLPYVLDRSIPVRRVFVRILSVRPGGAAVVRPIEPGERSPRFRR